MPYVFIDTETTGLDPDHDDVVEIAIVHEWGGKILLNSLVSPREGRTSWPEAQAIHGISPDMVTTAPKLESLRNLIADAVEGCDVVIYNAGFDAEFLSGYLDSASSIRCAMLRYSDYIGEWSDKRERVKWQRLSHAAEKTAYEWEGDAHRALADARACRHVWLWLEAREKRKYTAISDDGTWWGEVRLAGGDLIEICADSEGSPMRGSVKITLKEAKGRLWPIVYSWDDEHLRVNCEGSTDYSYAVPGDILDSFVHLEKGHSDGNAEKVFAEILTFMPERSKWDEWLRRWSEQP